MMWASDERGEATFCIAPGHPCLDGHFPGHPVVPGVVIIDCVRARLMDRLGEAVLVGLPQFKFLHPLRPDEQATMRWAMQSTPQLDIDVRVDVLLGETAIARGTLRFRASAS